MIKYTILLLIVITGCGTQTPAEVYFDDFRKEYPEADIAIVDRNETSCWTENKKSHKFLSLHSNLNKEQVYNAALNCLQIGM